MIKITSIYIERKGNTNRKKRTNSLRKDGIPVFYVR